MARRAPAGGGRQLGRGVAGLDVVCSNREWARWDVRGTAAGCALPAHARSLEVSCGRSRYEQTRDARPLRPALGLLGTVGARCTSVRTRVRRTGQVRVTARVATPARGPRAIYCTVDCAAAAQGRRFHDNGRKGPGGRQRWCGRCNPVAGSGAPPPLLACRAPRGRFQAHGLGSTRPGAALQGWARGRVHSGRAGGPRARGQTTAR